MKKLCDISWADELHLSTRAKRVLVHCGLDTMDKFIDFNGDTCLAPQFGPVTEAEIDFLQDYCKSLKERWASL